MESIVQALTDLVSQFPASGELPAEDKVKHAEEPILAAKAKSAAFSGTLALPPGPAGLLTILPDLLVIWRIQRQSVADIAAAFGRHAKLSPQAMLYCLFRHAASQEVRGLVERVGQRVLVRRTSLNVAAGFGKGRHPRDPARSREGGESVGSHLGRRAGGRRCLARYGPVRKDRDRFVIASGGKGQSDERYPVGFLTS